MTAAINSGPDVTESKSGLDKETTVSMIVICIEDTTKRLLRWRHGGSPYGQSLYASPVAASKGVSAFNYQAAGDALYNKGVYWERCRL